MMKQMYVAFIFTISFGQLLAQPINNNCAGAIALSVSNDLQSCTSATFNNSGATDSGVPVENQVCATVYAGGDLWYSFTAPANGYVFIQPVSAGVGIIPEIFSGNCGGLVNLGCAVGDIGGLSPGQTYYLRLWTVNNEIGTVDFCLFTQPLPDNNDCSGAENIPVSAEGSCGVTIDTIFNFASLSSVTPASCMDQFDTRDVWYSFTGTAAGGMKITQTGDGYAVYSGNSCGNLTQVACSSFGGVTTLLANQGQTYYIRVFGSSALDINCCVEEVSIPPINDLCSGAIAVPVGQGSCGTVETAEFDFANASPIVTPSCDAYDPVTADLWYSFVAPPNGNTTVDIQSNNVFASHIAVYESTCSNLTEFYCERLSGSDDFLVEGLNPGQSYLIRFFVTSSISGSLKQVSFCLEEGPAPPINDDCGGSITISVDPGDCTGTTNYLFEGSGISSPASSCSIGIYGDLWFDFVATATSIILESEMQNAVTLYSGACGSLTEIACFMSSTENVLSGLSIGQTYYLKIGSTETGTGLFCLKEDQSTTPANDNCANAINMIVGQFANGTTAGATASSIADPLCGDYSGKDVWYKFTTNADPNYNGLLLVKNTLNAFEFQVYQGTCGNLTPVQCHKAADNENRQVNGLSPNTEYHLRAWHPGYGNMDTLRIQVGGSGVDTDMPPNDACVDAENINTQLSSGSNITFHSTNASSFNDATPSCSSFNGGGVWYDFTAPSSGNISIKTNSGFEKGFGYAIYSGSCGALTEFACGSSVSGFFVPPFNVSGLTPGATYLLQVYDVCFDSYTEFGSFKVTIGDPTPTNDECSGSIDITPSGSTCDTYTINGEFATASNVPNSSCDPMPDADVWYSITAPSSGNFFIENLTVDENVFIGIYQGSCGSLSFIECDLLAGFKEFAGLTPGTTYQLRIWQNLGNLDGFQFCVRQGVGVPANDLCSNAEVVPVTGTATCQNLTFGYTYNASDSGAPDPGCGYSNDVWYQFVAPTSGAINFDLDEAVEDLYWAIYQGSCGGLQQLTPCGLINPTIQNNLGGLVPGNSYLIRLWNVGSLEDFFSFCIKETVAQAPNNFCFAPESITLGDGICGPNVSPDFSLAQPSTSQTCESGLSDLYYTFNAPSSGNISIQLSAGAESATLEIAEGNCFSLSQISCLNVTNSTVEIFGLTPGQQYHAIAMGASNQSNFSFCIEGLPAPPPNDECANAITLPLSDTTCQNSISTTTFGATDTDADCLVGSKEVYYQFTTTDAGNYSIKTSNASESLTVMLYEGDCTTNLIACLPNQFISSLKENQLYTLVIATTNPNTFTTFDLCVHPFEASAGSDHNVGIGVVNPIQKLQISDGLMIGNTETGIAGSVRFTGVDFEGHNGANWISLTGGAAGDNLGDHSATQPLNMNNRSITNLSTPSSPADAANKGYVDGHTDADSNPGNELITNISQSGLEVTITEAGNDHVFNITPTPGDDLGDHTATQTLDMGSQKIENLATPTAPGDAVTKAYADGLGGGDDLGNHIATQNIDMSNNRIRNLALPSLSGDAATKSYVDNHSDNDSDPANELNLTLGRVGNEIRLKDGGGTLSLDLTTFPNQWQLGINDELYYNDGGVIIGGIVAEQTLDVRGTTQIKRNSTGGTTPHLDLVQTTSGGFSRLKFSNEIEDEHHWIIATQSNNQSQTSSRFNIFDGGQGGGNRLTILGNGRTGINKSTGLEDRFSINSSASENAFRVQVNGSTKFRVLSNGGITMGTNNVNVPANKTYINNALGVDITDPNYTLVAQGRISAAWEQAQTNHMDMGHGGVNGYLNVAGGNMDFRSNDVTQMSLTSGGNLLIGTTSNGSGHKINTNANGAHLTSGGTWTNGSSRLFKGNYQSVNAKDVLESVSKLSIHKWQYHNSQEGPHLGPIAEDFFEAFGLGASPQHISTVDADGVALVSIQALYQVQKTADEKIKSLEDDLQLAKAQIESLEEQMKMVLEAIEKEK